VCVYGNVAMKPPYRYHILIKMLIKEKKQGLEVCSSGTVPALKLSLNPSIKKPPQKPKKPQKTSPKQNKTQNKTVRLAKSPIISLDSYTLHSSHRQLLLYHLRKLKVISFEKVELD
jgi:hypothetical protein